MPDPQDNDDRKVKDLLDDATRADLERWFGLPSYQVVAEQGGRPEPAEPAARREPPEAPEIAEARKRRARAIAAVDPAMLEAHRRRTQPDRPVIAPRPALTLHVDPGLTRIDVTRAQGGSIAEPRDYERDPAIEDALTERTPQALLRDLHRPESRFDKQLEWTDALAEYRVDVTANAAAVMATRTRLVIEPVSPFARARAMLDQSRAERRQPWAELELPRRRVTE